MTSSATWSSPYGGNWANPSNWQGNTVPINDGSAEVNFSSATKVFVSTSTALNLSSLNVSGAVLGFSLGSSNYSTVTLHDGLTFAPTSSSATGQIFTPISLSANQTWNIASGELELFGNLFGSANLTKTGAGTLAIFSYNQGQVSSSVPDGGGTAAVNGSAYSGNIILNEGGLIIANDYALGIGTLIIGAPITANLPYLSLQQGAHEIANNVVLNGLLLVTDGDTLNLYGDVTLSASSTISASGSPIFLHGNVSESGGARKLTVDGFSGVVLTGSGNSYSGGSAANRGLLVFGQSDSLPTTGTLSAALTGYLGIAFVPANVQTAFLDRFDKANTNGTIGFDTDPDVFKTNSFSSSINLTGFGASARLGSATQALITGTITPQGSDYQFGGGGGFLEVSSVLSGAHGVKAFAPDFPIPLATATQSAEEYFLSIASAASSPLIVLLSGTNTFTGNVSATNAGLAFGPDALPADVVLKASQGGYISTADPFFLGPMGTLTASTNINSFITRFDPTMKNGIIGFDDATGNYANVGGYSDTLDLTRFVSATDPGIYLGSASDVGLWAAITLPANSTTYRFAGYQGGTINIFSTLTGTRSVVIGDPLNIATIGKFSALSDGEFFDDLSTVQLSGENTYTGGTTLYAGLLIANGGSSGVDTSVLGTGALTVEPGLISSMNSPDSTDAYAALAVSGNNVIVPNDIVLNARLALTNVFGSNYQLSGVISGAGDLKKMDAHTVTLSNENIFTGRLLIEDGMVVLTNSDAAGHSILEFGGGDNDDGYYTPTATASFTTYYPVIAGLATNQDDGGNTIATVKLKTEALLTINQSINTEFSGIITGGAEVTKAGPGRLVLSGASTYTGLTTVAGGALVADNDYALGTGEVKVDGGFLAVASGITLSNTLILTAGKIGGAGTFDPSTTPIIGSGVTLAPGGGLGHSPIGTLQFGAAGLTLAGGGTYEWNLQSANVASFGGDYVNLGSVILGLAAPGSPGGVGADQASGVLDITATSLDRFTLRLVSLAASGVAGSVGDFNSNQFYSWQLIGANGGITGFDANAFTIDATAFTNALNGGIFSVVQTNNFLMLEFTPVPEPSTWALLIVGLGAVVIFSRRRK